MTSKGREGTNRGTWAVAEAKARFSEVIDRALANGPQTITRKGQKAVVVVSAEEWQCKTNRKGNPRGILRSLAYAGIGPQD